MSTVRFRRPPRAPRPVVPGDDVVAAAATGAGRGQPVQRLVHRAARAVRAGVGGLPAGGAAQPDHLRRRVVLPDLGAGHGGRVAALGPLAEPRPGAAAALGVPAPPRTHPRPGPADRRGPADPRGVGRPGRRRRCGRSRRPSGCGSAGRDDDDFGSVRIGVGRQQLATPLVPGQSGPVEDLDPLSATALRRFVTTHRAVPDLPLRVALRRFAALGCPHRTTPAAARALVRALLCQAAVFHAPSDLVVAGLHRATRTTPTGRG